MRRGRYRTGSCWATPCTTARGTSPCRHDTPAARTGRRSGRTTTGPSRGTYTPSYPSYPDYDPGTYYGSQAPQYPYAPTFDPSTFYAPMDPSFDVSQYGFQQEPGYIPPPDLQADPWGGVATRTAFSAYIPQWEAKEQAASFSPFGSYDAPM